MINHFHYAAYIISRVDNILFFLMGFFKDSFSTISTSFFNNCENSYSKSIISNKVISEVLSKETRISTSLLREKSSRNDEPNIDNSFTLYFLHKRTRSL